MADKVRAKFYVYSVQRSVNGGQVVLNPVSRGQENAQWASATPAGKIEMTILNELAVDFFEPGQEYYIDFTPAPKEAPK